MKPMMARQTGHIVGVLADAGITASDAMQHAPRGSSLGAQLSLGLGFSHGLFRDRNPAQGTGMMMFAEPGLDAPVKEWRR